MKIDRNVLSLENGYKFLYSGGHEQFEYLQGKKRISNEAVEIFKFNETENDEYCKERGVSYLSVVFPSRPVVLRSMLQVDGIEVNSTFDKDRYLESAYYPIDILEGNLDCIHKTDTHYSSVGTWKVVKALLNKLGLEINLIPAFERTNKVGDLNRMLNVLEPEEIDRFIGFQRGQPRIFNNRVSLTGNTGHIKIARNPLSKVDKRLMIFGDSFFADDAFDQLSHIFTEVIYVRSENFQKLLVDCLQPDVVLSGVAERYLGSIKRNVDSDFPFSKFVSADVFSDNPVPEEFAEAFNAVFSPRNGVAYSSWVDKVDRDFFSLMIDCGGLANLHKCMSLDYAEGTLSEPAMRYALKLFSNIDYMTQEEIICSQKDLYRNAPYINKHFDISVYSSEVGREFDSFDEGYLHWILKGRKLGVAYSSNYCSTLKIGLKCKDEPELLGFWIKYHASIVGFENLIIFDTGSTDENHLKILEEFRGKILIYSYEKYYNKLHNTLINRDVFEPISLTCKYFTLLDTDEYLNCFDNNVLLKDGILPLLRHSNEKVFCGIWLHNDSLPEFNDSGVDSVYLDLDERSLMKGFIDGKAIVRSDCLAELRHIGHNLHVKEVANAVTDNSIGSIYVIHLSKLGKKITRSRILKHLKSREIIQGVECEIDLDDYLQANKGRYAGKEKIYIDLYLNATDSIESARYRECTNILNLNTKRCIQQGLLDSVNKLDFKSILSDRAKYLNNR